MKADVTMPRLSDSMTEGAVTAWFRQVGDAVAEGDAIAELETEKSTVDLLAPAAGVLLRIVVEAGSGPVPVGTLLAEIETDAAAVAAASSPAAAASSSASSSASSQASPVAAPAASTPSTEREAKAAPVSRVDSPGAAASGSSATASATTSTTATDDAAIPATPLARRMAAQAGLSLASLDRSGIGGKVSKADVEAALGRVAATGASAGIAATANAGSRPAAALPAPTPAGVPQPLSRMRRTVADRMARAKATIPHFYLSVDCRVDRLLAVRDTLKADGLAVSVNDFVVRAAALALRVVPDANASWTDAGIVRHERVDVAVAVALDDGLVTPVVRAVDTLGLAAIGAAVRDLAARAREGRLAPHEYDGGTFTVSNLGMHGIGAMFAIVNPPQACILGVGAAEPRPVVEGGAVVAGTVMTLSLSADHRVLDGATGAKLLAAIRRLLEEPARMLA